MTQVLIGLPDWLAQATVCGITIPNYWGKTAALSGLEVRFGQEGEGLDGRCLTVDADHFEAWVHGTWTDVPPIKDANDLVAFEDAFYSRIAHGWIGKGIRIIRPETVAIDASVDIQAGCQIWPGVVLRGQTLLAEDVEVQAGCWMEDTTVGTGAIIKPHSVCHGARIGPMAQVGPMAHLRQGSVLEARTKLGNFVEMKKSILREGAKASHLTYLGNADIGARANIGAGTITCNYDGFSKHQTDIGADAFIGSNTALVAPVRVGSGAIIGAGSVITNDIPDNALALGRARQRVWEHRATLLRKKMKRRKDTAEDDR